ncbi:hypothetical protein MVES1_003487 [Malassezia vespertilionis]|uniref:BTB domain-containing protein n=1 Tax=Malassezia vespertilionis TaxID=2020962 RepID=A0A2N1J714_9BASI|nr:uncharacterized protein MVES1_003487 [Malassezia vespertilionis]PKI82340.1 hypothetical protein MVES_003725 [Malassezia vespertilionis]WFD08117.1 hypothetical protein MVES1_003487 [Malassezia vespertilionis]
MLSVPSLLDCWHVRDLPRFRRVLKGGPLERNADKAQLPASHSHSHSHGSGHSTVQGPCAPAEVNRRDYFGRTVLHLLASSDDIAAHDYLEQLLTHPSVNLNLQDKESGWTALHRALYAGNLRVAIRLLQRPDVDTSLRDHEGFAPFDLYNLTVRGTHPSAEDATDGMDLFVWGANRNYTLGLGRHDDNTLPERVKLRRPETQAQSVQDLDKCMDYLARGDAQPVPGARFTRPRVHDIVMSKWHSVVVTNERRANVYVCGIGTQARTGRMPQTLPAYEPLRDFQERALCAAVGQDHTMLVTSNGALYTFGSNRMGQLGYVLEEGLGTVASSTGTARSSSAPTKVQSGMSISVSGTELDLQVTPRRVLGNLKRETVLGCAASRLHSVAFTSDAVYTWGTNTGQLGYDRSAAPVQILPRKVATISQPVRQVVATEFATACLLTSGDVAVLHGDAHFRISFPVARLSMDTSLFRPRQTQPKPTIAKLTSSGTTFAALSDVGDLFTFTLEHPADLRGATTKAMAPKPQLVWSVRRKFSAVRDVAIGPDGMLLLCTASGHAYLRTQRNDSIKSKSTLARASKFQSVPFLQRIVRVVVNDTGSFAALQAPSQLREIPMRGRPFETELLRLLPHMNSTRSDCNASDASSDARSSISNSSDAHHSRLSSASDSDSDDDAMEGNMLRRYATQAQTLVSNAVKLRPKLQYPCIQLPDTFAHAGCDALLVVETGKYYVPAHKLMLAARIPSLRTAIWNKAALADPLLGVAVSFDQNGLCVIQRPDLSLISAMFFLQYIYTDDVPPVWTANLGMLIGSVSRALGVTTAPVLPELRMLSSSLHLDALYRALLSGVFRTPEPTMQSALQHVFDRVAVHPKGALNTDDPSLDTVLQLADRDVACHSFFLRRSPMLHSLYEWHRSRGDTGTVYINLEHQPWRVVRIGLVFLYSQGDLAIFHGTDQAVGPDQFIDLVLDVLQLADELLLDQLQSLCLILLRQRVKATNVGALLYDSAKYNAVAFSEACMDYAARNLETLLESGYLNELDGLNMAKLEDYIQRKQDQLLSRTLAKDHLLALTLKHQAFVDALDIPPPSLHLVCLKVAKWAKSPVLAAADSKSPQICASQGDESLLFAMDDVDEARPSHEEEKQHAENWQTVTQRIQPKVRSPAVLPVSADKQPRHWNLDAQTPNSPLAPHQLLHPRKPSALPSSLPSVTTETQEALATMQLSARVSQKERKKQRHAPEPSLQQSLPVAPGKVAWNTSSPKQASGSWKAPTAGFPNARSPASPSALSFAQIQAQQHAALEQEASQQAPKSFAQIIHEEQHARERHLQEQQEAEAFERWFDQESRRVQQESLRGRRGKNAGARGGRGRGRGQRSVPARIDDDKCI